MKSDYLNTGQRYLSLRHEPESTLNGRHELGIPHEPQAPLERAFSPAAGDYEAAEDNEHIELPAPIVAPVRIETLPTSGFVPIPIEEQKPISVPQPRGPPIEDELRAQLAASQAEISRLRKLLESIPEPPAGGVAAGESDGPSIRRRRSDKSDTVTMLSERTDVTGSDFGTYVGSGSSQPEGIPPQVVGILCIVVFTLTYVFF